MVFGGFSLYSKPERNNKKEGNILQMKIICERHILPEKLDDCKPGRRRGREKVNKY